MKLIFNRQNIILLILIFYSSIAWSQSVVEKKWTIKPGWNSLFIDVQPENNSPASVFQNLPPGSSVWCYINTNSDVQYISNPDEDLLKVPGWCAWFNSSDKAFLISLHAIVSSWSYLVYNGGTADIELGITGTPSVKRAEWKANSFNLKGFRVRTDIKPDFASFLSPSSAHSEQAVYRLDNSTGKWVFVDDLSKETVNSGEAYWVYCEGASEYQGPLEVILPGNNGLDYGKYSEKLILTFNNSSKKSISFSMKNLFGSVDLEYRTFNSKTGTFEWIDLNSMPMVSLGAGKSVNIHVAVRRASMSSDKAESIVKIYDDSGTEMIVPVYVEKEI